MPSSRRRLLPRLAVLGAVALAATAALLPGAADAASTVPTITSSLSSGTLADLDTTGHSANLDWGSFACQAGSPNTTFGAFLLTPGVIDSESDWASLLDVSDGTATTPYEHDTNIGGMSAGGPTNGVTDSSGTLLTAGINPYIWGSDASGYWVRNAGSPDGNSSVTYAAAWQYGYIAPGTYTYGIVCLTGSNSGNAVPELDSSGDPLVAQAFVTFDADGNWTWTTAAPVVKTGTTTTLTAKQDSAGATTVNLTATVKAANGTANPTGTVDFYAGTDTSGTPAATGTLSGGTATATITGAPLGSDTYTAVYHGDDSFTASTSAPAPVTVKAGTAVTLSGTATGTEAVLTATVQSGGTTLTGAAGTVTFTGTAGGTRSDTGVTVTDGVATDTVTGLTPGSSYSFTASYVAGSSENYASSAASSAATVKIADATADATVTPDSAVHPGDTVTITLPAGTFTAGNTIQAVLHSDPVALTLTPSTVGSDGSVNATAVIPAGTAAGSHTIVITDTTDATATAHAATLTVTASTSTPSPTPSSTAAATTGANPNDPVSFATGLVARTASAAARQPATTGVAAGLAGLVLLAAAAWYWRRRNGRALPLSRLNPHPAAKKE